MTGEGAPGPRDPVLSEPGEVWRLTLNRPEARNAVSAAMLARLAAGLAASAADGGCRVVVLAGNGPDFCAGADLGELLEARRAAAADAGLARVRAGHADAVERVLRAVRDHPRPVLAAVRGAALGAGCQLVTACDLAVAAHDARIGIPSARLGIVIDYDNVERLVAAVGPKRAAEILLAARTLDGSEAAAWGLVGRAVPAGDLAGEVDRLAAAVAGLAPLSVSASKRGIVAVLRRIAGGADGREEFDRMAAAAFGSDDLLEGLAAFRERRRPAFRGR